MQYIRMVDNLVIILNRLQIEQVVQGVRIFFNDVHRLRFVQRVRIFSPDLPDMLVARRTNFVPTIDENPEINVILGT